jgi:RNA polymerase sigma-70 factor, ECF subfamily
LNHTAAVTKLRRLDLSHLLRIRRRSFPRADMINGPGFGPSRKMVVGCLNLFQWTGDLSSVNASHSQPTGTPAAASAVEEDRLGQVEEQLLVIRIQHHDHEAFKALLQLYDRRILYYIRRLVDDHEAALDVSQDVWMTVYQNVEMLRSPEAFRVWLFRVAHNQATTAARRRQRRVEVHQELAEEDTETESWDEPIPFENAPLVHRALEAISPAHREVLALRFLEDMQLNEIAEVVGCSVATTKTRLHYAKKAFRRHFETLHQQEGQL